MRSSTCCAVSSAKRSKRPYAQNQRRSAHPLNLNGSESRFPTRPICSDHPKTLYQIDTRFPASPSFIHFISDCLQGGSNLRASDVRPFRRTLGISRSENGSVL